MFLEKFTVVVERLSLCDVNRQFAINFSTHEAKGLGSIFSPNPREEEPIMTNEDNNHFHQFSSLATICQLQVLVHFIVSREWIESL